MNAAQVRSITVLVPANCPFLVRLPDGTVGEIVGYTSERNVVVLETVLPEDEK